MRYLTLQVIHLILDVIGAQCRKCILNVLVEISQDLLGLRLAQSHPSHVGRIHVLPNQAESMPKIIKVVQPSAAGIDILIEEQLAVPPSSRRTNEQTNRQREPALSRPSAFVNGRPRIARSSEAKSHKITVYIVSRCGKGSR